jgi:hypothetical protein
MRSTSARRTLSTRLLGGTDAAMPRDLASIMAQDGDYPHAQSLYSESLVLFRTLGGGSHSCDPHLPRGIAVAQGNHSEAIRLCEQALALIADLL